MCQNLSRANTLFGLNETEFQRYIIIFNHNSHSRAEARCERITSQLHKHRITHTTAINTYESKMLIYNKNRSLLLVQGHIERANFFGQTFNLENFFFNKIIFLWIIKTVDHYGTVSFAARDVQLFTCMKRLPI